MASEARGDHATVRSSEPVPAAALAAFADAGRALAEAASLSEALRAIAGAAVRATSADVVVARVLDPADERLYARGVAAFSGALAAELEGTGFPAAELPLAEASDPDRLPETVRRAAARAGARSALLVPIVLGDRPLGSLELLRAHDRFSPTERLLARLVAYHVGLAIRAFGEDGHRGDDGGAALALERVGDALAAGFDEARTAETTARLAAEATGAVAGLLWRGEGERAPALVASFGLPEDATEDEIGTASAAAARALQDRRPVAVDGDLDGLPHEAGVSLCLQLGQPPVGVLQLLFPPGRTPSREVLGRVTTFGVRAAHALRASESARTVAAELERTRALLGVVGQAIAQLSLAHTLETAVERVAELLEADRLAIYLREESKLMAAAGLGLAGPHVRVASRLLELALGPFRGRGLLVIEHTRADRRLRGVQEALAEAGIDAAIAVPLLAHEEVIGLLAVYPPAGRTLTPNESALLSALAVQLAVAVQNAKLHEQAKLLGAELEHALAAERQSARQLQALYEISRSFAESLSLEATLDALARTVVELLEVDAAAIRMPDERREHLVAKKVHVGEVRLAPAVEVILSRPQPLATLPAHRLFRLGRPLLLDATTARRLGGSHELLVPFLEKGSTAAVLPVKTPAEVLATLTLLSLDPGRPITDDTVQTAMAIAGQAALALERARLYEQQKDFADTMQRSLLPRSAPVLPGLEIGDVYESSARLEVGGDVYDYLVLGDAQLAVCLGDVTGHGVEATADMALAKFVFRSLAREHPEPASFLASANEVVVGEVAPGKFITMVYLAIDAAHGTVACAGAGHPPPRLVGPDGTVSGLAARGLALGIEPGQTYEEVRSPLPPGGSVVLYTDGVIEARRDSELYGLERLDGLLARGRDLPAAALAAEVLADCRAFAGGELADDCAVVVIKRTED